jgi:hypothetical protein
MESYFLSETVKYLYLSFVDSGPLLDYYVLSTEGHLMPAFPHASDRHLIKGEFMLRSTEAGQQPDSSTGTAKLAADASSHDTTAGKVASNSSSSSNVTAGSDAGSGGGVGTTSGSLAGKPLGSLPANCRGLCEERSAEEEAGYEARLHAALPLLPVRRAYSRRIR